MTINKNNKENKQVFEIEDVAQGDVNILSIDDISKEDLLNMVAELQSQLDEKEQQNTFIVEPLLFDVIAEDINSEEFKEGVKIGSKLVGLYTVLINGGISLETAMDMVINYQTLASNIEVVKSQAKTLKRSSGV